MGNTFMDYSSHVKLTKIIDEDRKGLIWFGVIDYEQRRSTTYIAVNDIVRSTKHKDAIAIITDHKEPIDVSSFDVDVLVNVVESDDDIVSTIIDALPVNYDRRARTVVLDMDVDFTDEEISKLMSNNIVIFSINMLNKKGTYTDKYKYTVQAEIPERQTVLLCHVSKWG